MSIFPSYKFKSTTWDLVQYHFRSIDTWLEGVCRSHCPDHPWDSASLAIAAAAGRRSIFSDQVNDEEDCNADMPELPSSLEGAPSSCAEEGSDDSCNGGGDGEEVIAESTESALPEPPITKGALAVVATAAELKPPALKGKRISGASSSGASSGSLKRGDEKASRASVERDVKSYYVGQSNG